MHIQEFLNIRSSIIWNTAGTEKILLPNIKQDHLLNIRRFLRVRRRKKIASYQYWNEVIRLEIEYRNGKLDKYKKRIIKYNIKTQILKINK